MRFVVGFVCACHVSDVALLVVLVWCIRPSALLLCTRLPWTSMGWAPLGWAGLLWAGLLWAGLLWVGLGCAPLGSAVPGTDLLGRHGLVKDMLRPA